MIYRDQCCARIGLVGNPSDGYNGKTIAVAIRNFWAEATVYESPRVELRPAPQDQSNFESVEEMLHNIACTGYYGGIRLLKAAVKKFVEYHRHDGIDLPDRNFTLQYKTNIPRQVGLGGSSAIITAVMRALSRFYDAPIPRHILPNVVLAAETEELQLSAGLQDRVVQAYGGAVYMDFDEEFMEERGYGRYEQLDRSTLPSLYMAYWPDAGQESGKTHDRVRERYELGEEKVVETMDRIAALTDDAREALENEHHDELPDILDRNFDLRARIYSIDEHDRDMVDRAREAGASAKLCGSGGAIVGTYPDTDCFDELSESLSSAGYRVVTPRVAPPAEHGAEQ
ncbi:MAG: GHMP kinase [Planctomycetota bacterium]